MKVLRYSFFIILTGFFLVPAESKLFNNDYISFDMPENWKCKPFGTDWVCHSSLSKKKKEAMIILTAKQAGVLDNPQEYQKFSKTPRPTKAGGKASISKVLHSKQVFINKQAWVDGFHRGSEVPSYYTRYLVTVCCGNSSSKLAILVTYSAHKNHYKKYAKGFLESIKSLRVINSKNFGKIKGLEVGESIGNISGYMEGLISDEEMTDSEEEEGEAPFSTDTSQMVALIAVPAIIALYLLARRRRNKKRSQKRKKHRKK